MIQRSTAETGSNRRNAFDNEDKDEGNNETDPTAAVSKLVSRLETSAVELISRLEPAGVKPVPREGIGVEDFLLIPRIMEKSAADKSAKLEIEAAAAKLEIGAEMSAADKALTV